MKLQKFAIILLLLFPIFSSAQPKTDAELMLAIFKNEKREVVREFLGLYEDNDSPAFWKVYDAYEIKRKDLSQQRIALIGEYAANALDLNNAEADKLAKKYFKTNKRLLQLRKRYYKKMSKAIGAVKAIEFVQMEYYIDVLIQTETMQVLPFVGE